MMAAILNSPLSNDPFMDGYNMGQRDAEFVIDRLRLEVKAMSHELDRLRAENAKLREALQFYADGAIYASCEKNGPGTVARNALVKTANETERDRK